MVKNPPTMQETCVWSLGWENHLQEGMATYFIILAWRIPWTEEPGGLYSPWGSKQSDMTEWLSISQREHKAQYWIPLSTYSGILAFWLSQCPWFSGKESACNAGDLRLIPGLGRSPGGGHGHPLQYSCLKNLHGKRSLVGYSPWSHKESDMTERPSTMKVKEAETEKPHLRH